MKNHILRVVTFTALLFFCAMFWFLVVCVVTAYAEVGLDILGLAKINPQMVAEEIDHGTAIGVLDSTFGPVYMGLRTVVNSGKVTSYRVHLRDFTCYRSSHCPNGYPDQSATKSVRQAAKRLAEFQSGYPSIKCYVSPALEHDVKDRAVVNKWYKILDEVVPNCTPVCSSYTGYCPDKTPNGRKILKEKHGNEASAEIRSNDGNSLFDSDSVKFRTSASILSLGWAPEFNGRVSGEKEFTPPLNRVNFATRVLVRQAVRVMRPPTPRPEVANCRPITEPELGKTNAENYGVGHDDGRGNKFLFISSKVRGQEIEIATISGKGIGCLKYFGTYSAGGSRFYIGTCSGQSPTGLMDQFGGSEWGLLRWPGGCRVFNAIRRTGYTRP